MFDKIIFCNCNGDAIDKKVKKQVFDQVSRTNSEQIELDDLCWLCASNKAEVKDLLGSKGNKLILACHPRAVKLLLNYAGINDFDTISFLNLRDNDAKNSINELAKLTENNSLKSTIKTLSATSEWPAWYPVLDYSRCTKCGQCADFCLFGVYKKEAGKVEVINPESCKINCPACARICPQIAIVFPKYVNGGAISGSENYDEQEEQKRLLGDMDAILGGDIYQALEQRKAKRQSIIKNDAMQKALEEGNNALKENE